MNVVGPSQSLSTVVIDKLTKIMEEEGSKKKWAAVFDIDETLLLNINRERVRKNPATAPVVTWLRNHGVKLFAVTARSFTKGIREYSLQQLTAVGHDDYDEDSIGLTYDNYEDFSRSWCKYRWRRKIMREGYEIILNAGDNFSDLFVLQEHRLDRLARLDEINGQNLVNGIDLKELERQYDGSQEYLFPEDRTQYRTSRLSWKLPNTYTVA